MKTNRIKFKAGLLPFMLAAFVLSIASQLKATTYYVDSRAGSDSYTGTSRTVSGSAGPWQTVAKVNAQTFSPGDIIAFRRGSTWSGTNLQFQGSGTSTSIIRGTCYDDTGVIGDGGSGSLPAFTGTTTYVSGSHLTQNVTVVLSNVQYWTLEDLDVSSGLYSAVGVWCANFSSATILSGITLRYLNVHDSWYNPTEGWYANGITVDNAGASSEKFDKLTIDHCTVYNSRSYGIWVTSSQTVANTTNSANYDTNVTISNNDVHDTASSGIFIAGCEKFEFTSNTINNAGGWVPSSGAQTGIPFTGMFWGACYGGTIEHNTITNTPAGEGKGTSTLIDSCAIDADIGSLGAFLVQYNFTNKNYGGFMEVLRNSLSDVTNPGATNSLVIRYNLSLNDDIGSLASNLNYTALIQPIGEHQRFYHNTFYCPTNPAIINRRYPDDTNYPNKDGSLENFRDNIFYCPHGLVNCESGSITTNNTMTYDHNCFSSSSVTGMFTNTSPLTADPVFRNESSPTVATDLQLLTTSPCWNAGVLTGADPSPPADDFDYAFDQGLTMGADVFEDEIRYSFENNLNDSSAHANNGTYSSGSPTFLGSGQQHDGSYCLSLDGTQYVTAGSTIGSVFGAELGLDLWVYPTTSSGYRRLVDEMAVGGHDGFLLDLTPSNDVRLIVAFSQVITTTALALNTWSHVEAVYSQNGTIAIYLNGVQQATATVGNVAVPSNTYKINIGADRSGGERFAGRLDDVKIRKDSVLR